MLLKRTLVILAILPIGILAIHAGGWFYTAVAAILGGISAWEYTRLMRLSGAQPFVFLVVVGTILLFLQRQWDGFRTSHFVLSLLILAGLVYHMLAFERGRQAAASDFAATVGGVLYLGWIGAYLVSLRSFSEGHWWTFLVLSAGWAADIGAYFIGTRWGRHRLSPRLSPKKTWEGFWGGVVSGFLCGLLLGYLFPLLGASIPAVSGLWIGLIAGVVTTLGDLGESLFKRQAGVKDSGNLLPGHGGVFDRIDSWIWMGVVGYYLVFWFWAT